MDTGKVFWIALLRIGSYYSVSKISTMSYFIKL